MSGGSRISGLLARSSRQEALRLYRDILRTARLFRHLPGPNGRSMEEEIVRSARAEFESNRHLTDPEEIARLIVVGRDCLMTIQEKIANPPPTPVPPPPRRSNLADDDLLRPPPRRVVARPSSLEQAFLHSQDPTLPQSPLLIPPQDGSKRQR